MYKIRPIKPKPMKLNVLKDATEKGLDRGAKIVQKSFQETMGTFKRKHPVRINRRKAYRFIWVDDRVYSFINYGTSIRWAVMSSDWRSKTRPGSIRPRSGRGKPVVIGRRAMTRRGISPKPGIRARRFDKAIVERDAPKVHRVIKDDLAKSVRRLF